MLTTFPYGTSWQIFGLGIFLYFISRVSIMLDEQHHEELRALRNLEKAVRAFSVTAGVVSSQRRMEILSIALREVVEARKRAIRKSRLTRAG